MSSVSQVRDYIASEPPIYENIASFCGKLQSSSEPIDEPHQEIEEVGYNIVD